MGFSFTGDPRACAIFRLEGDVNADMRLKSRVVLDSLLSSFDEVLPSEEIGLRGGLSMLPLRLAVDCWLTTESRLPPGLVGEQGDSDFSLPGFDLLDFLEGLPNACCCTVSGL